MDIKVIGSKEMKAMSSHPKYQKKYQLSYITCINKTLHKFRKTETVFNKRFRFLDN